MRKEKKGSRRRNSIAVDTDNGELWPIPLLCELRIEYRYAGCFPLGSSVFSSLKMDDCEHVCVRACDAILKAGIGAGAVSVKLWWHRFITGSSLYRLFTREDFLQTEKRRQVS